MRMHLSNHPFPHIIIDNFLTEKELREALGAMRTLPFEKKESDLFSFEQSPDLTASNHPGISGVREHLQKIMPLLSDEFHVQLKSIDMSAIRYTDTSYLLCHDDRLETRAVAYIVYLTDLKRSEGGTLLLRSSKKPYKPIVKINPKKNRLVLFKVGSNSWHEVEEIKGENAIRLALSGWMHA
jgi:prolyl 3-hydroxylase /prolyl 3,4-dihydroxylase